VCTCTPRLRQIVYDTLGCSENSRRITRPELWAFQAATATRIVPATLTWLGPTQLRGWNG